MRGTQNSDGAGGIWVYELLKLTNWSSLKLEWAKQGQQWLRDGTDKNWRRRAEETHLKKVIFLALHNKHRRGSARAIKLGASLDRTSLLIIVQENPSYLDSTWAAENGGS